MSSPAVASQTSPANCGWFDPAHAKNWIAGLERTCEEENVRHGLRREIGRATRRGPPGFATIDTIWKCRGIANASLYITAEIRVPNCSRSKRGVDVLGDYCGQHRRRCSRQRKARRFSQQTGCPETLRQRDRGEEARGNIGPRRSQSRRSGRIAVPASHATMPGHWPADDGIAAKEDR